MNKTLSKEIMKRTRLRNKFFKNRNDYNKKEFSKQRNYCVSLVRKSKKLYFSNLDEKKVADNKTFWKTIKRFLSNKIVSREKVTLMEEDEIVENDITQALIQDFVREGGWLAPKILGAFLGGSGGMLPQKSFKIESARLA